MKKLNETSTPDVVQDNLKTPTEIRAEFMEVHLLRRRRARIVTGVTVLGILLAYVLRALAAYSA